MQFDVFGEGEDLLWVMGWGNRADSRHERWFIDRLVEAGYRVHAAEVPTNGTDFERDYLAPLREYRADLGDHVVLSHSLGGLVVAHLQPDQPAVYLSPFWGLEGVPRILTPLIYLPIATPFFPNEIDPEALGELATAEDVTAPGKISPKWVLTMKRAHESLPPLSADAIVFYTPDDEVVDVEAIESHARDEQVRTYDGGHELFSSADREATVELVVDALDSV